MTCNLRKLTTWWNRPEAQNKNHSKAGITRKDAHCEVQTNISKLIEYQVVAIRKSMTFYAICGIKKQFVRS